MFSYEICCQPFAAESHDASFWLLNIRRAVSGIFYGTDAICHICISYMQCTLDRVASVQHPELTT